MGFSHSVLVIDDEVGARLALQAMLDGLHNVKTFATGREAVAFVQTNPEVAHAAFVDFTMPDMNGATVCALLRAADPTLALVGITGNVTAEFGVPLFARLEKRGTSPAQVREIAEQAVAATERLRRARECGKG